VYLLIAAGSLLAELVAGEVKYLKSFVMEFLIDVLKLVVLRCKSAACCGVDDEEHLSLVIRESRLAAVLCLYLEIVN